MTLQSNSVRLLGTKGGPAIRPGSTNPTANLLVLEGRKIVVDCGLGVTRGLVDQGMQLRDLSLIFITHLHSDHYLELGPLLHTAWTAGLKTSVIIYGPKGLDHYWSCFLESMHADIQLRINDEGRPSLADLVVIHEIAEGRITEIDGIAIDAMKNTHPPLVDTFALSFKANSGHIVFSGDTAYLQALSDFAQGADLLVHEAMLEAALPALFARINNGDDRLKQHWMRSHTMADDAGRIATQAGVKALALNHLIPSDDPDFTDAHWHEALASTWSGELHIGKDGLCIEFGDAV